MLIIPGTSIESKQILKIIFLPLNLSLEKPNAASEAIKTYKIVWVMATINEFKIHLPIFDSLKTLIKFSKVNPVKKSSGFSNIVWPLVSVTIEITTADNWKYTLEGLQKYKDGKEIEYTIEEIKLDNYVTRYEGYKIINSYKATGEIVPPDTGIKTTSSNSNNLYRELIVLLLGAASITYTFKKKEN